MDNIFNKQECSFQQDSLPGHKALSTKSWLEMNVMDYIRAEDSPPPSTDLNLLHYDLWAVLKNVLPLNVMIIWSP